MSNYEQKPGQGAIFKNDRKAADTHPDYQGRIISLSGEEMDLSLWVKTSKSGKKYFSVSAQEPWEKRKGKTQESNQAENNQEGEDDGMPF